MENFIKKYFLRKKLIFLIFFIVSNFIYILYLNYEDQLIKKSFQLEITYNDKEKASDFERFIVENNKDLSIRNNKIYIWSKKNNDYFKKIEMRVKQSLDLYFKDNTEKKINDLKILISELKLLNIDFSPPNIEVLEKKYFDKISKDIDIYKVEIINIEETLQDRIFNYILFIFYSLTFFMILIFLKII